MNPGYVEIDEKTYQTAHDNAWSIPDGLSASQVLNEMGLTYIGSRILPNGYAYDFFQDPEGNWRYQTRKGLRNEGLVEMDEVILGPPGTRNTDSQGRKKKRWSKEFSLSPASAPDTSEEEYLDTAVY